MKSSIAVPVARLGTLALLTGLAGCTSVGDGLFSGDKVDYRNTAATTKAQRLEVPPDLTQLARESRYQVQGGAISAAAVGSAGPNTGAAASASALPAAVAVSSLGNVRVERAGQTRWLVSSQSPEQLWPQIKAFWEQRGFTLSEDNATAGVMQTNWAENRAKLPNDIVRNTIGRLLGNVYDSGQRDRYRTRLERGTAGTEIYVSHSGVEEVYTSERKDSTTWRARDSDPELEAEMLALMMVSLGAKDDTARTAVAATAPAAAAAPGAPAAPANRSTVTQQGVTLVMVEPFDRAWRRVGLALDRSGFTVEDRDRSAGVYYVRYVDPKNAGKEEPGWWARLFGDRSNPQEALRYRVAVKAGAERTTVSIQNSVGAAETGDNAQRIVGLLATELQK